MQNSQLPVKSMGKLEIIMGRAVCAQFPSYSDVTPLHSDQ